MPASSIISRNNAAFSPTVDSGCGFRGPVRRSWPQPRHPLRAAGSGLLFLQGGPMSGLFFAVFVSGQHLGPRTPATAPSTSQNASDCSMFSPGIEPPLCLVEQCQRRLFRYNIRVSDSTDSALNLPVNLPITTLAPFRSSRAWMRSESDLACTLAALVSTPFITWCGSVLTTPLTRPWLVTPPMLRCRSRWFGVRGR